MGAIEHSIDAHHDQEEAQPPGSQYCHDCDSWFFDPECEVCQAHEITNKASHHLIEALEELVWPKMMEYYRRDQAIIKKLKATLKNLHETLNGAYTEMGHDPQFANKIMAECLKITKEFDGATAVGS